MDVKKGKEYCAALLDGTSEEELAERENISMRDLYYIVEYEDVKVARKYLKHFCDAYNAGICFIWPLRDEAYCDAAGYKLKCPLNRYPLPA